MASCPAIPIQLQDDSRQPPVEIDGARGARGPGLDVAAFRQHLAEHKVECCANAAPARTPVRWRATSYYEGRRVRLGWIGTETC